MPSTLRLPFWAATRFRLEQILISQLDITWSEGWRLREMFAFTEPEIAFARTMLERRRNLWLYRSNQRHFCGDFLAVDMSARSRRKTYAVELKAGEALRLGVGGIQFTGLPAALTEIAGAARDGPVITAQGDPAAVLRWIGRP